MSGDDDAGALVELAEQMEEQRSAGGAERQVAKLVEDDEIGVGEPGCDLSWFGEMRLARTAAADQDDIVGVFQELAAVELTRKRLVDLAAGEVEAGEIAIVREAGGLELIGRRSDLSVGRLGLQELRQDWHGGFEGRGALFGQLADRLSH